MNIYIGSELYKSLYKIHEKSVLYGGTTQTRRLGRFKLHHHTSRQLIQQGKSNYPKNVSSIPSNNFPWASQSCPQETGIIIIPSPYLCHQVHSVNTKPIMTKEKPGLIASQTRLGAQRLENSDSL